MPDDLRQLVERAEAIIGMAETPRVDDPLALWKGDFGDLYLERCEPTKEEITARCLQWQTIMGKTRFPPASWTKMQSDITFAEIGCNQGQNLTALRQLYRGVNLIGIEPNAKARSRIPLDVANVMEGTAQDIPLPDESVDLAFTSGVLIHIPPSDLLKACSEVVRISRRYVVAIEYFSAQPRELVYRGHGGALWTRDFGGYFLDNFPMKPVAAGFSWKRLTGLDDTHWWLLEKR